MEGCVGALAEVERSTASRMGSELNDDCGEAIRTFCGFQNIGIWKPSGKKKTDLFTTSAQQSSLVEQSIDGILCIKD